MNEDLIWAASEIDGSSYFMIRMEGNCYSAVIRLRRRDKQVIDDIRRVLGGNIGHGKEGWWLSFSNQKCTEVLIKILPYMRKKVALAQILMEFNDQVAERRKIKGRLTEEEIMWRHNQMLRLKMSRQ